MVNKNTQNNESVFFKNDITLIDILQMLLSNIKWLLLFGAVAALLTYVGVSLFVKPTYQSDVTMFVYNENASQKNDTVKNDDIQAAQNLAETYSLILKSNSMLNAVRNDIGKNVVTRDELQNMTKVGTVDNSQLLQIVISSNSAEKALKIAKSFEKVAPKKIVRITKVGGVEVVDHAELATNPSSPKKLMLTLIAFAIGVILSAFVFVFRSISDITLYTSEDIESFLDVPILGQVPQINNTVPDSQHKWKLIQGGSIRYEK